MHRDRFPQQRPSVRVGATENAHLGPWYVMEEKKNTLIIAYPVLFSEPASHHLRPTKRWRRSAHGLQCWQAETRQVVFLGHDGREMKRNTDGMHGQMLMHLFIFSLGFGQMRKNAIWHGVCFCVVQKGKRCKGLFNVNNNTWGGRANPFNCSDNSPYKHANVGSLVGLQQDHRVKWRNGETIKPKLL